MARRFSNKFKENAVKLVLEDNKSQKQIAEEIGVSRGILGGWVMKYKLNPEEGLQSGHILSQAEIELKHLREEIKVLQVENETLRRALAIFVKNQKL